MPMNERPCEGSRKDLKFCLQQSDCVKRDGHLPSECLKNNTLFPAECEGFRKTLWACKRSVFDMRQRFRGRKGY